MYKSELQFEAVYTDISEPGYHLLIRKDSLGSRQENVIKVLILEVKDETLICHFEILVNDIQDEDAENLIFEVLLGEFCLDYYKDSAQLVEFVNAVSGKKSLIPYR